MRNNNSDSKEESINIVRKKVFYFCIKNNTRANIYEYNNEYKISQMLVYRRDRPAILMFDPL